MDTLMTYDDEPEKSTANLHDLGPDAALIFPAGDEPGAAVAGLETAEGQSGAREAGDEVPAALDAAARAEVTPPSDFNRDESRGLTRGPSAPIIDSRSAVVDEHLRAPLTVVRGKKGKVNKFLSCKDGEIIKDESAGRMSEGEFSRIAVSKVDQLVPLISALTINDAFLFGIPKDKRGDIVTKNKRSSLLARAPENSNKIISRSRDCFSYPSGLALLALDCDKLPYSSIEELDSVLCECIPGWKGVRVLYNFSSTCYLYDAATGKQLKGLRVHAYVIIDKGEYIPATLKAINLLLKGVGIEIDTSVGTPEHFIFAGPATYDNSVRSERPAPVLYGERQVLLSEPIIKAGHPKADKILNGEGIAQAENLNSKDNYHYAELIALKCPQVAYFRDTGSPFEPHWHSAVSIVALCADGKEFVHKWSAKYEGYNKQETDKKYENAVKENKPHTCETFSKHNGLCNACPHKKAANPIKLSNFEISSGKPPKTGFNARFALRRLGIKLAYDEFAHTIVVAKNNDDRQCVVWRSLEDKDVIGLRLEIELQFRISFAKEFLYDVLTCVAHENPIHPPRQYFSRAEKEWDGVSRIDTWLSAFLGADDSPYVREVGAKWLISAVRRVRKPGTLVKGVLILEGPQNIGKSGALRILSIRDEYFIDNVTIGADAQKTNEQLSGKLVVEFAELANIRKSEVEELKAFLSRTQDKAREAYGRIPVERQRQCIFAGSTNKNTYLKDQTGNCRFLPVRVRRVEFVALKRDLQQLWGEAARRESAGESHELSDGVKLLAQQEQEQRLENDPWLEVIERATCDASGMPVDGKVRGETVLDWLHIETGKRTQQHNDRLGTIMQSLGFERAKKHSPVLKKTVWLYARGDSPHEFVESTPKTTAKDASKGNVVEMKRP